MATNLYSKITTNKIVQYWRSDAELTEREKKEKEKNLLDNTQIIGEMSDSSKRRARKCIDYLMFTNQLRKINEKNYKIPNFNKRTFSRRNIERIPLEKVNLNFLTLTYPAPTNQSQQELKNRHLNHLVTELKKKYPSFLYFCKFETQKNGNLHFHLIINKNIHYLKIRNQWNRIIEKDGYVSRFQKKHGHSDPNSTDIKRIKSKKAIKNYIASYVNKKTFTETEKQLIQQMYQIKATNPETTFSEEWEQLYRRRVEGNNYSCSRELTQFEAVTVEGKAQYYIAENQWTEAVTDYYKVDSDFGSVEIYEYELDKIPRLKSYFIKKHLELMNKNNINEKILI